MSGKTYLLFLLKLRMGTTTDDDDTMSGLAAEPQRRAAPADAAAWAPETNKMISYVVHKKGRT
eukprot:7799191-Prorocentrum_lima.AAC.1